MSISPHSDQFYADLPQQEMPLSQLMDTREAFAPVPDDWHVIVTDIKSSTLAVQTGAHDLVNLVATGSMIAALNIAYGRGIQIPFFFGGDGATLILPAGILEPVMQALNEHRQNTLRNFDMDLRVGQVPVRDLYAEGYSLQITRARINDLFSIPVVLGGGLRQAERKVKAEDPALAPSESAENLLDLAGMECRWDHMKPPADHQEVVCLLVEVRDDQRQPILFRQVLSQIDDIYGPYARRQPVTAQRMRLQPGLSKIKMEMRVRLGKFDLAYLFESWLRTLIGKWYYFPFDKQGKAYLSSLVQLVDTLVIDGRINTVISGTAKQRKQLCEFLDRLEAAGEVWYGLHTSAESVMSCYVRDRRDQHIHFVDGADGGYTQAARVLKRKLRS